MTPGLIERDYAKAPLAEGEVHAILSAAGGIAPVLNTRHATAKKLGWVESPPEPGVFVAAVLSEPNLLRRPILFRDGKVVIGRDGPGWQALLA